MYERLKLQDAAKLGGLCFELLRFQHIWTLHFASTNKKHHIDELLDLRVDIIDHLKELFDLRTDRTIPQNKALNQHHLSDIAAILEAWDPEVTQYPLQNDEVSCYWVEMLCEVVMRLRHYLGIPKGYFASVSMGPGPYYLSERWQALRYHLPPDAPIVSLGTPENLAKALSESECIAVFGDIRNSQDLLYNTQPPEEYFRRLIGFTSLVRDLATAHGGVFDKFTGDGFLVVFFRDLMKRGWGARDFKWSFVDFIYELASAARLTFESWAKSTTKIPAGGYGLSIGADSGYIAADITQSELRLVGLPLVWASRMTSAAGNGEIVVNNQLRELLIGLDGVAMSEKNYTTKHGESFKGWSLTLDYPSDRHELIQYAKQKQSSSDQVASMFADRQVAQRSWEPFTEDEKGLLIELASRGASAEEIGTKLQRVPREIELYMKIGPDMIGTERLAKWRRRLSR